ncbi:MAG: hypothetical protein GX415_03065 [Chloroflexi bacterium]|jgi:hypothetical protein|nr:hypothetical protein [Anaerolineaceae bacterium]NLI44380.1 hypothetical protein [Chloroflexota bacterium]HOE34417.1 hypothetical protein [Anaerolineaceae bacterium]HOT25427.1 hypothetical protein [Anaerolineaceae bacterium]HQH57413.1 hypothetical protein [Anaerolineaceae bacterium]
MGIFNRKLRTDASGEAAPEKSNEALRAGLSLVEDDSSFLVGVSQLGEQARDRHVYDRLQVMDDCLDAWRFNPLARRIIELTTQYVIGGGMRVSCAESRALEFLLAFWNHPLNRMDARLAELSDELARSGNLFLLLSTDPGGMSYLRVVPSADIERISSQPNDVEQELRYHTRPDQNGISLTYPAYNPLDDDPAMPPVMLHYAVNRPAGAQWGESDLAPVLRWLSRYASWLEDRVRLNRFRNAFMYIVKARFASESARAARQSQLTANPPASGSVLVTDESEEWSVIAPRLEALDASTDGLAIKKMIAAGVGLPLHFLAEPESSTRTTAEASGGPTLRRFEQRQRVLRWILEDVLRAALRRRARVDASVNPTASFHVQAGDISARDNGALAEAGSKAAAVAQELYAQGLIDKAELLRLIYRFLGEGGEYVEIP